MIRKLFGILEMIFLKRRNIYKLITYFISLDVFDNNEI